MRRRIALLPVLAAALVFAGCGGRFELPTEKPGGFVPSDQSYSLLSTWKGQTDIQDLLITQGQGNQLFVVFNHGGTGGPSVPRGEVKLYPLSRPEPIGSPYFDPMATLYNPIAIAAATNKLFVLDQGDSCLAKYDPVRSTCEADPTPSTVTTQPRQHQIRDYAATWRVREYGLFGGDTLSTFTDTTIARPFGIAADEQGRVYVAALAVVLDTLQTDARIRTRKFVSRVYRYRRGQRYPGQNDINMPGTDRWYRDTTWVVFDGTGSASVSDPRGIQWSRTGTNPLFIADRGNNQVKGVSTAVINGSIARTDGSSTGSNLSAPEAVAADLAGFFYIVDRGNRRVLRYSLAGEFIQRVDSEPNSDGLPLLDPVGIAVDDSLAYIADRGRGEILRFKRRP